jgi:cytidylate kinase
MIIAIDGPAGAGKSTVAKILAQRLGFLYIDTGAMYRALTLKILDGKVDPQDSSAIVKLAETSSIDLTYSPDGSLKVLLDKQDVSLQIRQPRITKLVSDIAKIRGVREVMLRLQRKLSRGRDVILDGRDIGTVVFPNADKKFYIDAAFPERVNRRYKELIQAGQKVSQEEISADLRNRDTIDTTREVAPLKKAADAVYIDTTTMSIEEVINKASTYIR